MALVALTAMFGFVALSLFVWATESATPTRFWGLVFAGLYVVALWGYAAFRILTQAARERKRARFSFRKRTNELVAWLLLAFAVGVTVFVLGFFAGTPLVMQALLVGNIALLGGWLLLLHRVRRLPGANEPSK